MFQLLREYALSNVERRACGRAVAITVTTRSPHGPEIRSVNQLSAESEDDDEADAPRGQSKLRSTDSRSARTTVLAVEHEHPTMRVYPTSQTELLVD